MAAEAFQLWTLTIKPDHTATLACEDGNGKAASVYYFKRPKRQE